MASLALPVRPPVGDSGEAAVEMSDGEVLMTADTTRLSRYNDEVASAYRTTVAFEEMMRNRAPGRAPQRPTLILATDASTVMGTEMGVVQRIVGQVGPQDPEDLAGIDAGRGPRPRRAEWGDTRPRGKAGRIGSIPSTTRAALERTGCWCGRPRTRTWD